MEELAVEGLAAEVVAPEEVAGGESDVDQHTHFTTTALKTHLLPR